MTIWLGGEMKGSKRLKGSFRSEGDSERKTEKHILATEMGGNGYAKDMVYIFKKEGKKPLASYRMWEPKGPRGVIWANVYTVLFREQADVRLMETESGTELF